MNTYRVTVPVYAEVSFLVEADNLDTTDPVAVDEAMYDMPLADMLSRLCQSPALTQAGLDMSMDNLDWEQSVVSED